MYACNLASFPFILAIIFYPKSEFSERDKWNSELQSVLNPSGLDKKNTRFLFQPYRYSQNCLVGKWGFLFTKVEISFH